MAEEIWFDYYPYLFTPVTFETFKLFELNENGFQNSQKQLFPEEMLLEKYCQ